MSDFVLESDGYHQSDAMASKQVCHKPQGIITRNDSFIKMHCQITVCNPITAQHLESPRHYGANSRHQRPQKR